MEEVFEAGTVIVSKPHPLFGENEAVLLRDVSASDQWVCIKWQNGDVNAVDGFYPKSSFDFTPVRDDSEEVPAATLSEEEVDALCVAFEDATEALEGLRDLMESLGLLP